jgi:UDP-4-amino-4,6-dideoxy-N-acetyl-beta-L-altrosamine transaminase
MVDMPTDPSTFRLLPYGRHTIDDDDINAVVSALRGELIAGGGPIGDRFERAFAQHVGAQYAIVCSSGTAALHLAMCSLEIGKEDVVIVPAITFLATANAVRYVGAEVLFADVDENTGLLTKETLEEVAGRYPDAKIRAVVPVHMNGQSANMPEINAVATRFGWKIVEDSCHALGGKMAVGDTVYSVGECNFSDISAFSLHPVKAIAMGEGGMITTNNSSLAERMRRLRSHGMIRTPTDFTQDAEARSMDGRLNSWYYEMPEPGFNYRASEINSALGLSQLNKLDSFIERRSQLARLYASQLQKLAPVVRPAEKFTGVTHAWHLYVVLIDFDTIGISKSDLVTRLRNLGVDTQVHYLPVNRQPYYRGRYGDIKLTGADSYYAKCLSLPLYPSMTDDDVLYVVEKLANVVIR